MSAKENLEKSGWSSYQQVIVFDGVCNFCNASVDFVMKRDPQQKFKFGTLQSEPAKQILKDQQLDTEDFETFLLLERGKVFTKSTAALKIAKQLTGIWPLLYAFIMVPRPIRDGIYSFIARRRYHGWGKKKHAASRLQQSKNDLSRTKMR